jgi:hypothetical protein
MDGLVNSILEWLATASAIALGLSSSIFLILGMFRATRKLAGVGLVVSSYVFAVTLWAYSAVVTFTYWGWIGLIIGLVLLGVGVVPMSFLALALEANRLWVVGFGFLLVATFGARILGTYCLSQHWRET